MKKLLLVLILLLTLVSCTLNETITQESENFEATFIIEDGYIVEVILCSKFDNNECETNYPDKEETIMVFGRELTYKDREKVIEYMQEYLELLEYWFEVLN